MGNHYPGEEFDDVLAREAEIDVAKSKIRLAAAITELRAAIAEMNDSGCDPTLDTEAFDNFVHDELWSAA